MKNFFLIALLPFSMSYLHGDMKYDPFSDQCFSIPFDPAINQAEYHALYIYCLGVMIRTHGIDVLKDDKKLSKKIRLLNQKHICSFLEGVGSPAALRLIADIKKGFTQESLLEY